MSIFLYGVRFGAFTIGHERLGPTEILVVASGEEKIVVNIQENDRYWNEKYNEEKVQTHFSEIPKWKERQERKKTMSIAY